jgi:hypothetical protein
VNQKLVLTRDLYFQSASVAHRNSAIGDLDAGQSGLSVIFDASAQFKLYLLLTKARGFIKIVVEDPGLILYGSAGSSNSFLQSITLCARFCLVHIKIGTPYNPFHEKHLIM